MKAAASKTRISKRKRHSTARRIASRRLERLEADYRDVRSRLDRLQKTLDAALASGELTLATVDAEKLESVRRFESSRIREAGRRLHAEMESFKTEGVVDAKGRRVRKDVPQDMREGAGCDL